MEGRKREPKDREPGMLQPTGSQSDTTKRLSQIRTATKIIPFISNVTQSKLSNLT